MMIPIVLSRQPRRAPATARVENLGGEEVLIPVVKFIQSTYKGPSTIFLGMEQIERAGTRKRDPEAVITAAATTT